MREEQRRPGQSSLGSDGTQLCQSSGEGTHRHYSSMPGPWVPCLLTRLFFLVCSSSGQKLLVILERRGAGSEGSRTFLGPMLAVNMQAWPHQQDVVLRVRGAEALASPRGRFWVLRRDVCVLGPEAASRWCPLGSRGFRLGRGWVRAPPAVLEAAGALPAPAQHVGLSGAHPAGSPIRSR